MSSILEFYEPFQEKMLKQEKAKLTSQEWVGFYIRMKDTLPD
jgi:hypothetical protein